ncbi:O-antigen ligase like membrane protein [Rhizobium mongolense subsp. loessense]|uniref:O-antigen ligase like membrane protein n=2 Tax=Rhizobium mongolense TaxID=57676 RepID=A0A1G4TUS5_9HYPH|nr:O-antigen ligase like membrane protein [Rhizobium mongolense subsp. loessense]
MSLDDVTSANKIDERARGHEQPAVATISRSLELYAFFAAIFLCSMNYFRSDYIYFTLADLSFLLCFFLAVANANIVVNVIGKLSTAAWCFGLALLLLGLTASSIVSPGPERGLVVVLQYFYAYFIVLLLFGGRSYEELLAAAKIYVFSILAICIHGIYLIHVIGETNTQFVTGSGRFNGLMERENACAAVIALAIQVLLLLVSLRKLNWFLAICAFIVMTYGLLLTGSNTGLIGCGIGIAIFLLFNLTWRTVVPATALCLCIPLVAMTPLRDYLPDVFQKRVLTAVDTGDISQAGTFGRRFDLIQEAAGQTGSTLLLGIGADQYRVSSAIQKPVHNIYLLLWTEGGFIAALGFAAMVISLLGPALAASRIKNGLPFAICIFATVAAFLAMGNAMTHMYGRFWPVPLLIPAVLGQAFVKRSQA